MDKEQSQGPLEGTVCLLGQGNKWDEVLAWVSVRCATGPGGFGHDDERTVSRTAEPLTFHESRVRCFAQRGFELTGRAGEGGTLA